MGIQPETILTVCLISKAHALPIKSKRDVRLYQIRSYKPVLIFSRRDVPSERFHKIAYQRQNKSFLSKIFTFKLKNPTVKLFFNMNR